MVLDMTELCKTTKRPTSPHLQIYRWPLTMAASITHRVTGVGLAFGTIFVALWLVALAYNKPLFDTLDSWTHNFLVRIALFLYSFALLLHMAGGIRHLIWDVNTKLIEKHTATKMAAITYIVAFIVTIFVWTFGYISLGD